MIKLNPQIYKNDRISWLSWIYYLERKVCFILQKAVSVIHHANKLKKKAQMIISIDAQKGFS